MSHLKSEISKERKSSDWKIARGFTLIEILLVFALMGVLTATSVNSFFSYNRNQSFRTAVNNVVHELNAEKAKAISQVKPSTCVTPPLEGYGMWFPVPGTYYRVDMHCGGVNYVLARINLPSQVTFATGSQTVFFKVATGTIAASRTIIITGYGNTATITVDVSGNISVQGL